MTDAPAATTPTPRRRVVAALPWLLTLVLLGAVGIDRARREGSVEGTEAYHAAVRDAAEQVPIHFDQWLGFDVPVPQGAVTLLKPNVLLSRRYEQLGSNRRATLLVVQCRDARDLLGHFPPVCYPGQGWLLKSATPHDWKVDDLPIAGMQYVFRPGGPNDGSSELIVDNFMLLPDGRTQRDMDSVGRAAAHLRRKRLGAGQVQIVYDSTLSEQERREISEALVRQAAPLINAILHGFGEKQS